MRDYLDFWRKMWPAMICIAVVATLLFWAAGQNIAAAIISSLLVLLAGTLCTCIADKVMNHGE